MSEKTKKEVTQENKEVDLRGTFLSVMLLGGFIIVSWAGVWALFMYR